MAKAPLMFTASLLLSLLCSAPAMAQPPRGQGRPIVVAASLKASPAPFSQLLGTLEEGRKVWVVEESGPWSRVVDQSGLELGWLHSSVLQTRSLRFSQTGEEAEVNATSQEIALAGRGFNTDVEWDYRDEHAEISFEHIDLMEDQETSLEEILAFLQEGDLLSATQGEAP